MGRDKATLELEGRTLLERSIAALTDAGLDVLVVGRVQVPTGIACCADDEADRGPLGGVVTALRRVWERSILVVPCDVPDLDVRAVRWLIGRWREHPDRGLATRRDDHVEPLFAIYVTSGLTVMEDILNTGDGSVMTALAAVDARIIPLPSTMRPAVQDVDTPDAWRQRLGTRDVRAPGP